MYLTSIYILSDQGIWATLSDPSLHAMIYGTACIIASGFIINAFYDLERDTINRPKTVVFKRLISQQSCLNFYFFFNTIGMLLSFYVSKQVMLFNFMLSIALWLYSHKLKKKALIGNISGALLSISPFAVLTLFYRDFSAAVFFYAAYMGVVELVREIVKDVLAVKGDVIYGYQSIPIRHGEKRARILSIVFLLLAPVPLWLLTQYYAVGPYFFVMPILSGVILLLALLRLLTIKEETDYKLVNTFLKAVIAAGIICIPLINFAWGSCKIEKGWPLATPDMHVN